MTSTATPRTDRWSDKLSEIVGRNSRLLTAFLFITIFFGGVTLIENPSKWWVPVSLAVGGAVVFLTVTNVPSVVKAMLTGLLTLGVGTAVYGISQLVAPYSTNRFLWFAAFLVSALASLAYSYFTVKGKSRWGTLALSMLAGFVGGWVAIMESGSLLYAAIAHCVVGCAAFVFLYNFTRKTFYRSSAMPQNIIDDDNNDVTSRVMDAADNDDWFVRAFINHDKQTGHYLAWKDRAYVLLPVYMDSPFSAAGNKRRTGLGYHAKLIEPWLIDQAFNKTMFWRSRGANIMLILLDMNNANGSSPRPIGVELPDARKRNGIREKLPVGIYPARSLSTGKKQYNKILTKIDHEFHTFNRDLQDKHVQALERIGVKHEGELTSAYIDEGAEHSQDEAEDEEQH